jgi:HK97 family phage prohead protease
MTTPALKSLQRRVGTAKIELRVDDGQIPAGFCARVTGIALPYGVVDSYGTVFAAGCIDRTREKKVNTRKVKLFLDHNYGVPTHVGTVLAMPDVTGAALLDGGLFDTAGGREAKEYLEAVVASDSETGFSVGFYPRKEEMGTVDGGRVTVFTEIELDEVSITPRPAVPGATVTGIRKDAEIPEGEARETAERVLRALVETLPAERVTAIVAEVAAARQGGGAPPSEAPVTLPAADAAQVTSTSDGDVPVTERQKVLARHLNPTP